MRRHQDHLSAPDQAGAPRGPEPEPAARLQQRLAPHPAGRPQARDQAGALGRPA